MAQRSLRSSWWVTAALVVPIGLQLVRVFMATTNFYLVDAQGSSPLVGGVLALGVFVAGSFSPLLIGPAGAMRWSLPIGAVALATSRVIEQLARAPEVDLLVSSVGVVAFLYTLTLLTTEIGASTGLGVVLGISIDIALLGVSGSLGLSWMDGVLPVAVVVALATGLVVGAARPAEPSGTQPGPYVAILGPWLVLHVVVFGNLGFVGSATGFSAPVVWILCAFASTVAVLGATRSAPPGWVAWVLGALLIASIGVLTTSSGPGTAAGLVVGQGSAAVLLMVPFRSGSPNRSRVVAVGLLAIVLLLFLYYASYEFDLGFRSPLVLIVAAAAVLIGGASRRFESRPAFSGFPSLVAGVLMVPALVTALSTTSPVQPVFADHVDSIRIMTYNLHQGFNTSGRLDLEALAAVIEAENPDVVALQEVSRGWVVAGAVDMLNWLSERLDMPFASGPTADGQWGNAVLSRYPIVEAANISLPPGDLPLRRGYVDVVLDVGDERVRVLATHLHHVGPDEDIRVAQAQALIAAWESSPRTIVMGDLNATPDSLPIRILEEAGLIDGVRSRGPAQPTSPAEDPSRTIDYAFVSPDLSTRDISVQETPASDHLPVAMTVSFGA